LKIESEEQKQIFFRTLNSQLSTLNSQLKKIPGA